MEEIGGQRIVKTGMGNDKDDEKFETEFWEWLPNLCNEM